MKNRIIALLLGIIFGTGIWVSGEIYKKERIKEENIKIEKKIEKKNFEKKEHNIKKVKKEIISNINNAKTLNIDTVIKDNIKIVIYDYSEIYKKMYNIIITDESVNEQIGYKAFEETILYKRLIELQESITHTIIYGKNGKENHFNYIPIDIECINSLYCKKKIEKNYNDIYVSDKKILDLKIENGIDINKKIIIDLIESNKTFYDYFNNIK